MNGQFAVIVALHVAAAGPAAGQVQTFRNDYPGFAAAAGAVRMIDFETLPDGTPSDGHAGVQITGTFNYDLQGAHFSAPFDYPYIAGNPTNGFDLRASRLSTTDRTWIIADLTAPARAVGVFFPGGTQMCAYDAAGAQIGCVAYNSGGAHFFIGLVSSAHAVTRVVVDRGTSGEDIESFDFAAVPEPATALLLACSALWALRHRPGRWRSRTGVPNFPGGG